MHFFLRISPSFGSCQLGILLHHSMCGDCEIRVWCELVSHFSNPTNVRRFMYCSQVVPVNNGRKRNEIGWLWLIDCCYVTCLESSEGVYNRRMTFKEGKNALKWAKEDGLSMTGMKHRIVCNLSKEKQERKIVYSVCVTCLTKRTFAKGIKFRQKIVWSTFDFTPFF